MKRPDEQGTQKNYQYALNLTLAAVAGQVGFITLFVIVVALFGGLALDKFLGTRPMFTIIFMIASVPVTVTLMFRIVRAATSRIKPAKQSKNPETPEEDKNRE
jgi:F0F1-type ATP synthase assembly protein I